MKWLNNLLTLSGLALMVGLWLGDFWGEPYVYIDSPAVRTADEHARYLERLRIKDPFVYGPAGDPRWGFPVYAASGQNVYATNQEPDR